jgi:hypothetical protein
MPLRKLPIQPGIVSDLTDYAGQGMWIDGDRIRFRNQFAEPIGGWLEFTPESFTGIARDIESWRAFSDGYGYYALGTHSKLYAGRGGSFVDITPIEDSGSLSEDPFETTQNSDLVEVTHTEHGRSEGDYVIFSGVAEFNGVDLNDEFPIVEVIDSDTYTVQTPVQATNSGSGGGSDAEYEYLLSTGESTAFPGYGWGAGGYGESTWNTPRLSTSIFINLSTWTLDMWGENLLANRRGGPIYEWRPSDGLTDNRAEPIANSPDANFILVSVPDRHLIAYGATDPSTDEIDPLLIRWSDQEDFTEWDPAITNTAGDQRLIDGSEIVGALRTRGQILVWTDRSVYAQQFVGGDFVFGFQRLGARTGLIGPHAAVDAAGTTFWMSDGAFYYFDGSLRRLPCPVYDKVFGDMNMTQTRQIYAGVNTRFNEVMWFYCSEDSDINDRYVIFNYREQVWYYGQMSRTTWMEGREVSDAPLATAPNGTLYRQESGLNAGTEPLNAQLVSGDLEIGEGDEYMHVSRIVPDVDVDSGAAYVAITMKDYPQGNEIKTDRYPVQSDTRFISTRARGRSMALTVGHEELDTFWRIGLVRVEMQPDGRR